MAAEPETDRQTWTIAQVAMMLVREMPVLAAARIIGITDQRLWRIVEHYVGKAVQRLDLTRLKAISLDETAAKRGQTYVTVFIDLDAKIPDGTLEPRVAKQELNRT